MKPTEFSILNFQFSISCVLAVAVLIGIPIDMNSQEIAQQPAYDIVGRYDTIPNIALYDTLGNIHYLQELKGKYLLLDFWYGTSVYTQASFSELKKVKDTMGDNVEIVSITFEPKEIWETASSQYGISWHNWNDLKARRKDGIWARYGVTVSPTFFIISPEGVVLDKLVGYAEGILMKVMSPANLSTYNKEAWERQQKELRLYEKRLAEQAKSVAPGNNYKEIRCKGVDGEEIALSDVVAKNRYVLLDFWASSCVPCMYELPRLQAAYDKYHSKGLEIYALSLDNDKNAWIKTIKDKELQWINVLCESSEATEQYGVRGVPSNFLIDCYTGKIIATHLRGEALSEKLAEIFE